MRDFTIKYMFCYGTYNKDKVNCDFCKRIQELSHATNSGWDDTYEHCKKLTELEQKLDERRNYNE